MTDILPALRDNYRWCIEPEYEEFSSRDRFGYTESGRRGTGKNTIRLEMATETVIKAFSTRRWFTVTHYPQRSEWTWDGVGMPVTIQGDAPEDVASAAESVLKAHEQRLRAWSWVGVYPPTDASAVAARDIQSPRRSI